MGRSMVGRRKWTAHDLLASRCAQDCEPIMACSECGEALKPEEVSAKLGTELTHMWHT